MSLSSSPRPILKKRVTSQSPTRHLGSHNSLGKDATSPRKTVKFSPGKSLVTSADTHSPSMYDRSPIVPSINVCEIPDRHGKIYEDGSPRRGRTRPGSRAKDVFPTSPTGPLSMHELADTLPGLPEEDEEMDLMPLRFQRPKTPIPTLGFEDDDDDDGDEEILPRGPAPMLPPLVPDSSESDDSDLTPPAEPTTISWTISDNALETALLGRRPSRAVLARSPKYPEQLSLSPSSQPPKHQKRSHLKAERHRVTRDVTQTPSYERDIFDDASCLDGF